MFFTTEYLIKINEMLPTRHFDFFHCSIRVVRNVDIDSNALAMMV